MKKLVSICCVFCFAVLVSAQSGVSDDAENIANFQSMTPEYALKKIRDTRFCDRITTEKISTFEKVLAGSPFKNEAAARFAIEKNNQTVPLADTDITIAYPVQDGTNCEIQYTHTKTDANGLVRFQLPEAFTYPLRSEVRFIVKLFNAPDEKPLEPKLLNDKELAQITVTFPCQIGGKKRNGVKASIDIVDFTRDGYPYSRNMLATALLGELMRRKYLWPGNYTSAVMRNFKQPMEDILPEVRQNFAGNVKDFIFGRSQITKIEQQDGSFVATCTLNAKIWNMHDDRLEREIHCETTASGASEAQAAMAAREKLGKEVLADIIEYSYEFH